MKLHYQIVGSGKPLVILHGLFGSSDNWRSIAKQLASYAKVITVDLRNHGRSLQSNQQTYSLMAGDLIELFNDLNIDKANILGHSVGGKVSMQFAAEYSDRVERFIVVDISPRAYAEDPEHLSILRTLLATDLSNYSKRSEVDHALKKMIPDDMIRQFLLMNIVTEQGKLKWRINLQAIYDNYANFTMAVAQHATITNPCCFICGGKSNYIQKADKELITRHFLNAEFYSIAQAGHWVHVDAPHEFLNKVKEFFNYD